MKPPAPTGQVVRQTRARLGLSQEAAAEKAGVSRRAWSEIELGHRQGSQLTLERMTKALGLPEGSLQALEAPPTADPSLAQLQRELLSLISQLSQSDLLLIRVEVGELILADAKRRQAQFLAHEASNEPPKRSRAVAS